MPDPKSLPSTLRMARRRLAGLSLVGAAFAGATAFAQSPAVAHHRASSEAAHIQRETVDQRIHTLHADLGITPAQEPAWNKVADVMRGNETVMRNMVAARHQSAAAKANAIDDLVVYEKFNEAHVEGIRKLIASFQPLYESMPDAQKAKANDVFRGFGRNRPLHS